MRKRSSRYLMLIAALVIVALLGALSAAATQQTQQLEAVECYNHGDVNGDGVVDNRDAIYTLYYSFFGDSTYPVNQSCDFTGDTVVSNQDAIYLLYASFGMFEDYQLKGVVHTYYDPVWSWTNTDGTVTARVVVKCGCGQEHSFTQQDADGVVVTAGQVKAPTCTASGVAPYEAKLVYDGNTFTDTYTVITPASGEHSLTGTQGCETAAACSQCDYVAQALGHSWKLDEAASTPATCQKQAVEVYKCENCTQTKSVTLEGTLEHTYEYMEGADLSKGNCVFVKQYKCSACKGVIEGTGENDTYTKHTYTAELTKEATCAQTGVKTYTCGVCSHSYTETLPKNDHHNWVEGATKDGVTSFSCACGATKTALCATGNEASVDKTDLQSSDQLQLGNGTTVALDDATVGQLDANKTITISVEEVDVSKTGLTAAQKAQVGDNTVYDFNMVYSNGEKVTDFAGEVTVSLPYTLQEGDDVDAIEVWFINDQGVPEMVNATYSNGFATFTTKHFSYYTVTYLTVQERCQKHGHLEVKRSKQASCTVDGYDQTWCQRCGELLSETKHQMTGHALADTANCRAATCDASGYSEQKCGKCGVVVKKELPAIGHDLKKDESLSKVATCQAPGLLVEACANAGCDHVQNTELAQLSHDFGSAEEVKPSCEAPGLKKRVCALCGEEETFDEKPMTGHNFLPKDAQWDWSEDHRKANVTLVCATDPNHKMNLTAVVTTEQTGGCQDGKLTYTAVATFNQVEYTTSYEQVLEATAHTPDKQLYNQDPAQHYYICTVCGEQLNAADHSWNSGTTVTAASCTKEGLKRYTCTVCKGTKDEVIPITHSFKNGKCTKCGTSEQCNHMEKNRKTTQLKTLGLCGGEYYTFTCDCGESSYDLIYKMTCKVGQGVTSTEKLADGTEVEVTTYTCAECGATLQHRGWMERENECVYKNRESITILVNGKQVLQGRVSAYEDEYGTHTQKTPEIIKVDGLCGPIEKRSCICGEETYYYDNCYWEYDHENSTEDTDIRVCVDCGAVMTDTFTSKPTGKSCEAEVTEVCTYTVDGAVVYTYTLTQTQEDHGDHVTMDYVFYGDSCTDGFYAYAKCTVCGLEAGMYMQEHNPYLEPVYTSLAGKGMCLTSGTQYACPCGEYMTVSVGGGCDFSERVSEKETATSYEAVYKCTVCGGTETTKATLTTGANCRITIRYDYTYKNKNGTKVYSGTDLMTGVRHDVLENAVLLGDSCEDGIWITRECKNCDMEESLTTYDHYTKSKRVDLSGMDTCSPYAEVYQCLCGENGDLRMGYDPETGNECWMDWISESQTQSIYRCYTCGLTRTDTYTEETDGCATERTVTVTFTKEGKTPVTTTYTNTYYDHKYIYTLELLEGAETCADGVHYSGVCSECGKKDEDVTNHCREFAVKRETIKVEGYCDDFELITYACGCGEEDFSEVYFGRCQMEGIGFTYDQEGNRIYIYECQVCGMTAQYRVSRVPTVGSCKVRENYDWSFFGTDGQQLFTLRNHYTDYDCIRVISQMDLEGETCIDGMEYSFECAACGRMLSSDWFEAGDMTCSMFAEWYSAFTVEAELLYRADCGKELWAVHNLGCPCGTYDYGWTFSVRGGDGDWRSNSQGYYCGCGEEDCTFRWKETETLISKDESCNASYKWAITIYEDEAVVKTMEKTYTALEHNEVLVDATLQGQICDDGGYTAVLRCTDCGAERTEEGYNCTRYNLIYETWTEGCGGYIQVRNCPCGNYGISTSWNSQCLSYYEYQQWWQDDAQGIEHYYEKYACDTCGTVLTFDTARNPVSGETCLFDFTTTITVVHDQTMVVRESYTVREVSHDEQYTYRLAEGAESCMDGVLETSSCSRCDYTYESDRVQHGHYEMVTDRVDLAQYGAKCGCTLVQYACACEEDVHYDFAQSSLCDLDEEEMDYEDLLQWQPDMLEDSYTTEGRFGFNNYGCVFTCAVTSPECGFKLRLAEVWLPEANCMMGEYQIWEVYDQTAGSWKQIIRSATGEHHAYHDYTETEIYEKVDGVTVNGTNYVCPDCGSTATWKVTRQANGSYQTEWIATNTMYQLNGELRQRHETEVYDYLNPRAAIGTKWLESYTYNTYTTAEGEEKWEKWEYSWDVENGCAYTRTISNSDGNWDQNSGTHGMGGSASNGIGKYPTCTQEGFRGWECEICGQPWDEEFEMLQPTDHTFQWNEAKGVYECWDCGLESAVDASGGIALEDLNATIYDDETKYVVGYWNQLNTTFTPYIYVVAEDATDDDKVFALVGLELQWLTVEADGVRALAFDKATAHEVALNTLASMKPGYTGRFAVRVEFVPNDTSSMHDYAITFDPVDP